MQKGQTALLLLVGLLITLTIGAGAYYLGRSTAPKIQPQNPVVASQTSQVSSSPSDASREPTGSVETADWKTYTNTKVGFSIKYPPRYSQPTLPSGAPGAPTLYANGSEDNTDILFGEKSTDLISLLVFPFSDQFEQLIGLETKTPLVTPSWIGGQPTKEAKDLIIDGGIAKWFKTTNPDGSDVGGDKIYFIGKGYGFILHSQFNHDQKELEQMTTSFKFLK